MELKYRKLIKNLPKFLDGNFWQAPSVSNQTGPTLTQPNLPVYGNQYAAVSAANTNNGSLNKPDYFKDTHKDAPLVMGMGNPWATAAIYAGSQVANALAFKETKSDELLVDSGTTNSSIGGIGYQRQNNVNGSEIMSQYDKNIVTGFLTNPGEAVGRLFHRNKQKEEIRKANEKAAAVTAMNKDIALTTKLLIDNAKEIGNLGVLYAKHGAMPGYAGPARVSKGETIVRFDGYGRVVDDYTVPGKPDNKDNKIAYVDRNTAVIPNKEGASKYYLETGDINGALAITRAHLLKMKYKNGKLPRFEDGWENIVPSAIGATIGLGLYFGAKNLQVYRPNTYAANPYENNALATLAELRMNPYPTLNQLRDAEARLNAAINASGGLSAGQRWLSRAATLNATQQNIGKYLADVQALNNAYRSAYANAALSAGQADAQRRQQATQWDADMYAKAHAARHGEMLMGLRNFLDQIQNYYANSWKKNQFDKMFGLYSQLQALDEARLKFDMDRYANSFNKPKDTPTSWTRIGSANHSPLGPRVQAQIANLTPSINKLQELQGSHDINTSTLADMDALIQKQLKRKKKK